MRRDGLRILLTGATGFLGSILWRRLLAAGHEVVGVKRNTSDLRRVADLVSAGKVLDADRMSAEALFEAARPQAVVHTACAYGRKGESAPDMVRANLLFPLGLLEQCARRGTLFVNTATMLEPGVNQYALSKAQLSQWMDHFAAKVPSVSLRLDHFYGPDDDAGEFAAWLLEQFEAGVEAVPLTAGEQTRDFIHVDDVANLFCLVLERRELFTGHTVIKAGSCVETRLKDFVLLLARLWEQETGRTLATRLDFGALPYRHGEAMRTVIAPIRVAGEPWRARIDLEHGLRDYVQHTTRRAG